MGLHLVKMMRGLALPILLVGLLTQCGHAGGLSNGDFSSGSTGWNVSDANYVSFVGGEAVMSEHLLDNEVLLWQQFTLSPNAMTLSLDLISLVTEADGGFLPDALNISLLDPLTMTSLVPTVNSVSDAYYTRDLVNGIVEGVAASGVTVLPSSSSLPLTVALDVSALSSQDVRLQFKLIGGGVDYSSSLTLDNVREVVPEPSSWLLFLVVGLGLFCIGRRRLTTSIRGGRAQVDQASVRGA